MISFSLSLSKAAAATSFIQHSCERVHTTYESSSCAFAVTPPPPCWSNLRSNKLSPLNPFRFAPSSVSSPSSSSSSAVAAPAATLSAQNAAGLLQCCPSLPMPGLPRFVYTAGRGVGVAALAQETSVGSSSFSWPLFKFQSTTVKVGLYVRRQIPRLVDSVGRRRRRHMEDTLLLLQFGSDRRQHTT